jgi:hypothetical protein
MLFIIGKNELYKYDLNKEYKIIGYNDWINDNSDVQFINKY